MTRALEVDVAVIGGGLVGSSAALALRHRGLSVALLDKGFCGAGASGVNYGGVRRQGRPPEQLPLAERAHSIWPQLKDRIGIDGEFARSGHLKLARNEADMAGLEAYSAQAGVAALGLELISRQGLKQRFGWIDGEVVGASFCAGDGHANPRLVAAGFVAAARRAGVQVFEHHPVREFVRLGTGFVMEAGAGAQPGLTLRARHLVNSAGAWAGSFAAMAGEPVPQTRIYPSMVVTEPVAPLLSVNIGMEGRGIYARQVARGNCIVGGGHGAALDDADFSRPTAEVSQAIMRRMAAYFPGLRHAQAIRFWTGTEAAMPDRNPVLCPSIAMPGLVHAFGFTGAGFQLAPGVGEVIAELIASGRTSTPIDAFSIHRFASPEPAATHGRKEQGSLAPPSTEPKQLGVPS